MHDQDFLTQFENCTLPKEQFTHQNHLRIAWLYLSKYPIDQAIVHITQGIKRYAASIGAAHIYHETLTRAWIYLVNQAMLKQNDGTFTQFIAANQALLASSLPLQYYSKTLLDSDNARKEWVQPDLQSF